MRKKYYRDRSPETAAIDDRKFQNARMAIPDPLMKVVKEYSKKLGRPQARLIAYALYNELQTAQPFTFNDGPPEDYAVHGARYALMGARLKVILEKEKYGLPKDVLILCASIWNFSENDMRGAIQWLIDHREVSLVYQAISHFDYPLDYVYLVTPKNAQRAVEQQLRQKAKIAMKPKGVLEDL